MRKKFKNITAWNIIWFLIYIFPFIYILGFIMFNQNNPMLNDDFLNYDLSYDFWYDGLGFNNSFIYYALESFVKLLYRGQNIAESVPNIVQCVCAYITYIIVISILRIGVDVILMLPNIVHNFIDKIGGERE